MPWQLSVDCLLYLWRQCVGLCVNLSRTRRFDVLLREYQKARNGVSDLGKLAPSKIINFWRSQFRRALLSDRVYRGFPYYKNMHGLAVGILYGSKQGESIAWGESHYSTYVM